MRRRRCSMDDVELEFKVTGQESGKPTLLLLNGLGTTHIVWAPMVRVLREAFTIVLWDYPGLGSSPPPSHREISVTGLADQVAAILDELGVTQAHLVGWSLGVQVAFEFARQRSSRITSLVGMAGVAGKPFDGVRGGQLWMSAMVPDALTWISERSEGLDRLRAILSKVEGPSRWAKRLGLIDPGADDLLFDAVVREFVAMDVAHYHRYVHAAAAHDAEDVAMAASFPVLLIAGERDRFTPVARLVKLSQSVPGAELFLVRGGTHFSALEYPDLVALKLREFIERRAAL